MSDTPVAPTTPEPYGVPETIAHWRRQAELCDSDMQSATFLHCADEIEEVLALVPARSTPAEALDVERLAIALISGTDHPDMDPLLEPESARFYAERIAAEYLRLSPHNREADHE